jgi:CheY-like chemotaxis protein
VLTQDLIFSSPLVTAASQRGWAVTMVPSVEKLLEFAARGHLRMVLIDLGMPGLDVKQAARQLRELPKPPKAVVAVGAHVDKAKLETAAQAGCDVLTRGQFSRDLDQLIERYLA